MKKLIAGIVVGLAIGGVATWTFLKHHEGNEKKEEPKKEEHKEEPRVQHGTNGETFLKLDKEAQEHAGLKVATLEAIELSPEVKGYGRVLDPAPLATLLVDGASARASLDASTKEYERLKTLFAQDQNISARSLETAEAALKRDQILVEAANTRLALSLGKAVANQKDLPAFIHSLANFETALVRVDLPLGVALKGQPTAGRVAPLVSEQSPVEAQFLGPATTADLAMQGQGFLFLLKGHSLPPGAAVVGWLKVPGEAESGVIVPREAILRHEGEVFVYLQTGDETFQRREIELERPLANGWFVGEGLKKNQKVVVVGAQQLLSEELKSAGGE